MDPSLFEVSYVITDLSICLSVCLSVSPIARPSVFEYLGDCSLVQIGEKRRFCQLVMISLLISRETPMILFQALLDFGIPMAI